MEISHAASEHVDIIGEKFIDTRNWFSLGNTKGLVDRIKEDDPDYQVSDEGCSIGDTFEDEQN